MRRQISAQRVATRQQISTDYSKNLGVYYKQKFFNKQTVARIKFLVRRSYVIPTLRNRQSNAI